jgi:ubiquinone biosynthesis monooxygenase Coq7
MLSDNNVGRLFTAASYRLCWPSMNTLDRWLSTVDNALRTVSGSVRAMRPNPAAGLVAEPMDEASRRLSGALMRVNHVGEVCAQALYQAQAMTARTPALRLQMEQAAREETDHLAWTQARLEELGARRSWLNPVWYAGAYASVCWRGGSGTASAWVLSSRPSVKSSST